MTATDDRTLDVDLLVLGGGATGLGAAAAGRAGGRSVAVVEEARTGGDCTFTGCVPSKTLLETAKHVAHARGGPQRGFSADVVVDLPAVLAHVRGVVEEVARDEDPDHLARRGIVVVPGRGRFTDRTTVEVTPSDGAPAGTPRRIRFTRCVLAAGGTATVPPIDGITDGPYLTNASVFDLRETPEHLVVLGAGAIGCEMSQAFQRLGVQVTLVEGAPRILSKEEPEAARVMHEVLTREGVRVLVGEQASAVSWGDGVTVTVGEQDVTGSHLLVALGRRPATSDLGAQEGGVALGPKGEVVTDAQLRTTNPAVWAAGDCTTPLQFTHVGDEQGRLAVRNAFAKADWVPWQLGGPEEFDDSVVPWTTFTEPEVGRVGLSEADAFARWGEAAQVSFVPLSTQDRARTTGQTDGFVKLVAAPIGGAVGARVGPAALRLVGMTAVAPTGGDLVAEGALAMRLHTPVARLARTIHAYPTWSLTTRVAAGGFFGAYGGRGARAARPDRG